MLRLSGCPSSFDPLHSRRSSRKTIISKRFGGNRSTHWLEKSGVEIKLPSISPQPYTHLAFEGYQYAKEHGLANEYNDRVLRAFFQEDQDIGQIDVLTKLAEAIGLNGQSSKPFWKPESTEQFTSRHWNTLQSRSASIQYQHS
jgi:predicted DsbA family dithiol-disulfide isomerase